MLFTVFIQGSVIPILQPSWSLNTRQCLTQGSVTFLPVDPDLLDTDPPCNALKFKMAQQEI